MTSPAPFASANRVTAAIASDNFNHSDKYEMAGARYSSTTADMNLKMSKIRINERNTMIYDYDSNLQSNALPTSNSIS